MGVGVSGMSEIIIGLESISEFLFNKGYNCWGNTIRRAISMLKESAENKRKNNIEQITEALEYLISDDNTETQFDFVDEIQDAIAVLRQIPKCFQDCAYQGSCNGECIVECSQKNRRVAQ